MTQPLCHQPIDHRFDFDHPGSECCGSDVQHGCCRSCREPSRLIVICDHCGEECDVETAQDLDYEKFLRETCVRVAMHEAIIMHKEMGHVL